MQTSRPTISTISASGERIARFQGEMGGPHRYRHARGGRGFTLIELLLVMGMMVILATVLFPVFAQARAKAQESTCASHLAQIAHAGLLYLQDYDERFPSCYALGTPPYVVDPRTSLQPYIKNWDLFYCPDRHTVLPDCLDPARGFRPNSRRVPA